MKKKRIKITEKSRVFYKIYLVNIVITMVFICLISVICSTSSSKLILNNFIAYNQNMMVEKGNILDERIRQLDETCNLIVGEENAFRLIMTDEQEYEKPTRLLLIIRYFRNICSGNSLIDGVSLIDCSREIMLTEKTKVELNMENARFYKSCENGSSFFLTEENGENYLEYVKQYEPIRGEKTVYVIIKVNQDAFTDNLLTGAESTMVEHYLLTSDGRSLSAEGADELSPDLRERFMSISRNAEKYETKSKKFVLYKNPSQISDICMAAVQDYTYLEQQTQNLRRMIIWVSVFMITVASVIIYLCSLYLYHPLKNLVIRIQELPVKKDDKPLRDEFHLLEQMVDTFQNEKAHTQPLVIRDSIQKLVRETFDQERFDYLKEIFHQSMEYSAYVLLITECKTDEVDKKRGFRFLKRLSEEPERDGFYTEITNERSIGIYNTDLGYETFVERAEDLKRQEEGENTPFICCISREFKNRESMNLVYSETLNSVEKAVFIGKLTLVCGRSSLERRTKGTVQKEEENRLIRYMADGKTEEALAALASITSGFGDNSEDIQYTRFLYFEVCRNLVKNSREMGVKLPSVCEERELFQEIFRAETIEELGNFTQEVFYCCLESFQKKERGYSSNIEKAIEFIQANYMRELSIDDVAASVFLSSGYLGIIFKEETGYTILEYITYVRMQKAGEMLRSHSEWKVKDVAEQLGYNNVQSFIRFFKKYYGQTPAAYRKGEGV